MARTAFDPGCKAAATSSSPHPRKSAVAAAASCNQPRKVASSPSPAARIRARAADQCIGAVTTIKRVGTRIANWDIKLADTVADNASSSMFVLGARPVMLHQFDPAACPMEMTRNNVQASTGNGRACLGNPLNAAIWLADVMNRLGQPLRAGDVILTGALGAMVPVARGDSFAAQIVGLGCVSVSFSK